jgi:hypothetical protein
MAQSSSAGRLRRRHDKLREQGMRPVQIWIPDTRAPGFAAEAARQGSLVGASYRQQDDLKFWSRPGEDDLEFWERIAEEHRADPWR